MEKTTNYYLKKPEYNEYADIKDINDNMDSIDTLIKTINDAISKAFNKEQADTFYAKLVHRHTTTDIDNLGPTIQGTKVNNSAYADNAGNSTKLNNQNWYFQGQAGQPTWVWGGSDGSNMYVYNPSNFSVANTNSVQGFQFRNNNGQLEVLVGGSWLSVGGKQYTVVRQGKIQNGQRFDYSGSGIARRVNITIESNDVARFYIDGVRVIPYYVSGFRYILENLEFKNSISLVTDVPNGHYTPTIEYLIQTEK